MPRDKIQPKLTIATWMLNAGEHPGDCFDAIARIVDGDTCWLYQEGTDPDKDATLLFLDREAMADLANFWLQKGLIKLKTRHYADPNNGVIFAVDGVEEGAGYKP